MYKEIFECLAGVGISSCEDLRRYPPDYNRLVIASTGDLARKVKPSVPGGFEFLTSDTYPWVQDIFEIVNRHHSAVLNEYLQRTKIPTLLNSPYGTLGKHSWTVTGRRFERRAKFGCIFPDQCLFLSNQFVAWGYEQALGLESKRACIPEDYLPTLLTLKPLLLAGMAHVLPSSIKYEGPDEFSRRTAEIYYLKMLGRVIVIDDEGMGSKAATESLRNPRRKAGGAIFFVRMPWLLNASLERFVELAQRHREELALYYSLMLRHIEEVCSGGSDLERVARDLQLATERLDILYRNKRDELRSKGEDVVLGTLVTLGCLIFPDAQMLTPFLGGKTVWEGVRLMHEVGEMKRLISHEDSWILWSMKNR